VSVAQKSAEQIKAACFDVVFCTLLQSARTFLKAPGVLWCGLLPSARHLSFRSVGLNLQA